ncbi:hypothetical protein DA2_1683 [Desulfovibrio sp. A2]|nr:hypothetical protein DA2_1683 [Desulfovibrio sp. A2]
MIKRHRAFSPPKASLSSASTSPNPRHLLAIIARLCENVVP